MTRLPRAWGVVPAALVVALLALRACVASDPLEQLAPAASDPRDPPGTTARTGSLDIARGGPVIIGFQSAAPARLVVGDREIGRSPPDCKTIAEGQVCRVVVPPGPIAVRFAAAPDSGARLVWSPVGRRGDPEYVPASSLVADPPATAQFGDGAGAARGDGAIALAILAVLVATLLVLVRARLAQVPRAMWIAMAAIAVAAVAVRGYDLGGFGQAWDEDTNWAAGRNYVTNLLGGDFAARSWTWNYEHPPVMKYLEGIGALFADGFGPARALSAVWTSIACALLVPIGARLYSLRVGVLAAAIATLLPPVIAHGQIVGHESPSMLWWTLGIVLALGVHDGAPTVKQLRVRLAWLGVVIGIAVASRFVNGLLGILGVAIVLLQAPPARRRATLVGSAMMAVISVATVYAVWPRLWLHPIANLADSLAKLSGTHSAEPFLGVETVHPPITYFGVYLIATLPIGAVVGVIAWMVRSIQARSGLVVLLWLIVPLGVAFSPVRQDGVRYVMPCVLALAVAAAAGWDAIATWLEPRVKYAFFGVAAALVIYLGVVDVRVHPYYLDYFAEQVGGAGTVAAHNWFETAWWGEGVADAVDYVNTHAEPGAPVWRSCIEPMHLAWFRSDLWPTMATSPSAATWIIAYAPASHHCRGIPATAERVYTVTEGDLVLAEVWHVPR